MFFIAVDEALCSPEVVGLNIFPTFQYNNITFTVLARYDERQGGVNLTTHARI